MLTFDQTMRIVLETARTVMRDHSIASNTRLRECGLGDDQRLALFLDSLVRTVRESGYRIRKSDLESSIDRNSTMYSVADLIMEYSLPGDDTFPEPPDEG